MTASSKFVYMGDDEWDLKANQPLEAFDRDKDYYIYKFSHFKADSMGRNIKFVLYNTIINLTAEKLSFLRSHSLYKRYNPNGLWYYVVELNDDLTYDINNNLYYSNKELEKNNITSLENIDLYEIKKYKHLGIL
jgi:hypothetical protein